MSRTTLLYKFLNAFISVALSVTFKEFSGKEIITIKNRITTIGNIRTDNNISKLQCASNCLVNTECEWIAYNTEMKTCRHHSVQLALLDIDTQSTILNGWSSYMFYENWCPYDKGFTHNRQLDLCYKLIPGAVPCSVAYQQCDDENSRVIIIDSAKKQSYITSIIVKDATMSSSWMDAYLDGGEWLWGTGLPMSSTYDNWDHGRGQPQNLPGCVGFSAQWSYYWHDFESYGYQHDTICEIRRPNV